MDWKTFVDEFGYNKRRKDLLAGMEKLIKELKKAKCQILYVDGSFASKKPFPNDYDACFDPTGVDFAKLYQNPVFFDRTPLRKIMKNAFGGEIFSATALAAPPKELYLDFFQHDRDDNPKGIIRLDLNAIS